MDIFPLRVLNKKLVSISSSTVRFSFKSILLVESLERNIQNKILELGELDIHTLGVAQSTIFNGPF